MKKCRQKIIVFDLDETIGHFEQLSMFLSGLQNFSIKTVSDKFIHKLLDLWPCAIRHGLINTLKIIKRAKVRNSSIKVVIYTNNMGDRSWTLTIKRYLEKKINYNLFDKVITAYRPQEKNNLRTSHFKTHSDLIRCTGYNPDSNIIFLDDVIHPGMYHKNVIYKNVVPYIYSIPFGQMIDDFIQSKYNTHIHETDIPIFKNYMMGYFKSDNNQDSYIIRKYRGKAYRNSNKDIIKSIKKFLDIKSYKSTKKFTKKNK